MSSKELKVTLYCLSCSHLLWELRVFNRQIQLGKPKYLCVCVRENEPHVDILVVNPIYTHLMAQATALGNLNHVEKHVIDVQFQKFRLVRNQIYQLRKCASEVVSFEAMQERQDTNHDHTEELMEHRGLEEQADDDSAKHCDLDVGVRR